MPLFTIIGVLLALPAGLIMTLPGKSVRPERLAIAMGVYFTCHYGGIGLLSALAGYTRDLTGSPAAPLWAITLQAAPRIAASRSCIRPSSRPD